MTGEGGRIFRSLKASRMFGIDGWMGRDTCWENFYGIYGNMGDDGRVILTQGKQQWRPGDFRVHGSFGKGSLTFFVILQISGSLISSQQSNSISAYIMVYIL